jgi:hypothetical protein
MQPLMEMPYGFSLSYASICQSAFRTFAVILPAPQTLGTPLLHSLRIKHLDQLSYCILRHNTTFMYCTEVQPSVSLHLEVNRRNMFLNNCCTWVCIPTREIKFQSQMQTHLEPTNYFRIRPSRARSNSHRMKSNNGRIGIGSVLVVHH